MSMLGDLLKFGIDVRDFNTVRFIGRNIQAQNVWYPTGNVYYVDGSVSASGSGRTWETAFKTIAEAVTVMNARIDWAASPWAKGDICFIAAGTYAENLTSLPYGCMLVGAGHDLRDAQFGTKIKPASGDVIDAGAVINSAFINIGFEAPASQDCFDAAIMNNNYFKNCFFTGPAETATARGIVTSDAVGNIIENCRFTCLDKGIDVNYADGGDSFSHNRIQDCEFLQVDTAGIEISTNLVGPSSVVNRCNFMGAGQTMAAAIDDNSAILDVAWCCAEATLGYDGVRSVNASYLNGSLQT